MFWIKCFRMSLALPLASHRLDKPMRIACAILFLLFASASRAASPSVVLGDATGQFAIEAEVPCPQRDKDEETICMDAWVGWNITVRKTLSGAPIMGRIRAARVQHTYYAKSYLKSFRLFVLHPIESPEMRKLLSADYLISDLSPKHSMYCTRHEPATFGLHDDEMNVHTSPDVDSPSHCFELTGVDK